MLSTTTASILSLQRVDKHSIHFIEIRKRKKMKENEKKEGSDLCWGFEEGIFVFTNQNSETEKPLNQKSRNGTCIQLLIIQFLNYLLK